jgi:hypothetical protein
VDRMVTMERRVIFPRYEYGMKRILLVVLALAFPLMAAPPDAIFDRYETARQALLKESLPAVQTAAKELGAAARSADQPKLATVATTVADAADLKAARAAFGKLSDEMIAYRKDAKGDKPVVAYCPMVQQSWLQPAGEIGNPYADAAMRGCGVVKEK